MSECQAEDVDESPSLADMPGKDEIEAFIASSQWCNEVPDVPDTPVATWGTLAWARLALALLAVGERDRRQIARLTETLVKAALPLEVLRGQIVTKAYRELTPELQAHIMAVVDEIRGAVLADEEDARP